MTRKNLMPSFGKAVAALVLATAVAPGRAAVPWRVSAGASCPDLDRVDPAWTDAFTETPPPGLRERHAAAEVSAAAPLLIDSHSGGWWLGLSHRGGPRLGEERDPACFLKGTVAYYVVGREDDPEVDFVKTVQGAGEASLASRLVELRWYDPADGRRHRWRNLALARKLGWSTDGLGRAESSDYWPNPLVSSLNTLY